jgi:hypothetical protein
MTFGDFQLIIQAIFDAHPRKTYSRDQLTRLYDELSVLTPSQFENIIQTLLDTNQYFPTLHSIRQAWRPTLDTLRSSSKVFSTCEKCGGTGQYDYQPRNMLKGGIIPRFAIACPYCKAADTRRLNPLVFPRIGIERFTETDDLALRLREARDKRFNEG